MSQQAQKPKPLIQQAEADAMYRHAEKLVAYYSARDLFKGADTQHMRHLAGTALMLALTELAEATDELFGTINAVFLDQPSGIERGTLVSEIGPDKVAA